jgi:putative transposase
MGRIPRIDIGNQFYHVINRANARLSIFNKDKDYEAFEKIIEEARDRYSMRILAYCIMPNHWHFVLNTRKEGDLNLFMQWLTLTHTQRWHAHYHSVGYGHLYQGRYKSFLIQNEQYLLTVCKYVESNALRAKLSKKTEDWRWSSIWRRKNGSLKQKGILSSWPMRIPPGYLESINRLQTDNELESMRESVNKSKPFGNDSWLDKIVKKFGLEMTLRRPGRPKNGT